MDDGAAAARQHLNMAARAILTADWATRGVMFRRCEKLLAALPGMVAPTPAVARAIDGALEAVGVYTFQLDRLGKKGRAAFAHAAKYEALKRIDAVRSELDLNV